MVPQKVVSPGQPTVQGGIGTGAGSEGNSSVSVPSSAGPAERERFNMSRVQLLLRDRRGRPVDVEFRLRRDTIEAWTYRHCLAVIDRERLRAWLLSPGEMLIEDEVAFAVAGQNVVVSVARHVPWSPLNEQLLRDLRTRV